MTTKTMLNRTAPLFFAAVVLLTPPAVSSYSGWSAASRQADRRGWLASAVGGSVAAVLLGEYPLQNNAAVAATTTKLTLFDDPARGFSLQVPADWKASSQMLRDRREFKLWTDESDPKTAIFIAYTPVRDDFTSLGSFGSVEQVGAQTILPKGELMGETGIQATMESAVAAKQAYIFDYTQAVENVQPKTRFRTIFALQQGATGGAGAMLVTITAQTPEERYQAELKPLFDEIIDSYGKSKS